MYWKSRAAMARCGISTQLIAFRISSRRARPGLRAPLTRRGDSPTLRAVARSSRIEILHPGRLDRHLTSLLTKDY